MRGTGLRCILKGMERVAWAVSGIGFLILIGALFLLLQQPESETSTSESIPAQKFMIIRSPAFNHEELIPRKYTCEGEDISPPLAFDDVPEGASSLVLIMDDPDAPMGTWDHWIRFNIPVSQTRVGEGEEPDGLSGNNSWGTRGYGGPCPPSGEHRYLFKLYAIDYLLDLPEGVGKDELMNALKGHVLESATLMGRYQKTL